MDYKFTVFTPTYNRAKTLPMVFESLKNQTIRDFEWIVVDDGSRDDTQALLKTFQAEADFPMQILTQENSGKHVAQNRAVERARGELFLPLDSDDTMIPESLEILWKAWEGLKRREDADSFSGIGVHCMDQNGSRIGDPWPEDGMISNDLKMHFRYGIRGEKWGPIATRVMREFKNQEVKAHFLTESTMWYRIAARYQKLYLDRCLRIYEIHEDSISAARPRKTGEPDSNYESFRCASCIYINEFWHWYLRYQPKQGIKMPMSLVKATVENGRRVLFGADAVIREIKPWFARGLMILVSPYQGVYALKHRKK